MDLLYEGNDPPSSFDGLNPILALDLAAAEARYAASKLVDPDYVMIINDGRVTKYFSPAPPPAVPTPNNPGNPYFGKTPKSPEHFWALILGVYIALGGSNEAGMDRQGRLLSSKRAQGIIKIVEAVSFIDPDDKDGDFLKMAALLTTTKHEDGQLLIEVAEFDAIMAAWKN